MKLLLLSVLAGVLGGSASALFLYFLDIATRLRLNHPWLLFGLPAAGAAVAFLYSCYGREVDSGSDLLIQEIHQPKKKIPLRMAPLVLVGTLITHLFGGSAGREGTAVQMGGGLADQLTGFFHLDNKLRKILLIAGMAAGFSSVFGTPFAATIFAIEVLAIGQLNYAALLPSFVAALVADLVSRAWGIQHSAYKIGDFLAFSLPQLFYAIVAGALFGLCARGFSGLSHKLKDVLKKNIPSNILRALVGGLAVVTLTFAIGTDRYLGLGIQVINEAFLTAVPTQDFLMKALFTIITLSAGFRGGEVTPLFFIGATLGNAMTWILPLPTSLMAGMGFVAVFAGATNTPLASIIMGIELFGFESSIYMALACVASYTFSGHKGIYHSQRIEVPKYD